MLRYKLGKHTITGDTAVEVVNKLRQGTYTTYPDNKEYMKSVQARMLVFNNNLIRITDEATFLSELERVNALKAV